MNVSVVIPTMNTRPDWLRESVASVNNQSIKPDEIIIVNNGIDYLKDINSEIPFRIVKTINRAGASQARNIGAAFTSCDYISFLDDDDLWEDDYIKKVIQTIEKHSNPDIIIARLDKLINGKISRWKDPKDNINIDTILIRNPGITGSSVTVKKTSFNEVSGYDVKLITGEDKALALDFLLNGYKVVENNNIQVIHREHDEANLSSYKNLSIGKIQFYKKYRKHMSISQKRKNLTKLLKYKIKGIIYSIG